MTDIRTRFAPSPTGYLHIGGARTALYCYLFARKTNGVFILRIEDTDVERSTLESVDAILDGLRWLNLHYQEGPFYQTSRFPRYQEMANQMLNEGSAYRCYCSKERLEALRKKQLSLKEKPRYDGFCRNRHEVGEGPFVIRFKNPEEGSVIFDDLIRGTLSFENKELDDLVIVRSDGTPTYNFTVVVDDLDMHVSHVLRGDDHINNTPRQINIFRALKATPPFYAHLPMILGQDGKRLSKRHGAVSVMQYRDDGFLPEALLNYLARLGWSHGDQEIFSMDELIQYFEVKNINRAAAAFNPEKLLWLNQQYFKILSPERIAEELTWHFQQLNIDTTNGPPLTRIIMAQRERTKTLREMAERSRYFFEDVMVKDEEVSISEEIKPAFIELKDQLALLKDWHRENIHQALQMIAEKNGLKLGKLAQPLRIAVTGGTVSPPIDETLELIGQERAIKRMSNFIDKYISAP